MMERAVSVTLDYILMLLIATTLLAGVVAVSGGMIDDQVDRGVNNELEAAGESLAAEIQGVERVINTSDPNETTVELTVDLPNHVGNEGYRISIVDDGKQIELISSRSDTAVTIPVRADRLDSTEGTIAGGTVVVRAEDGSIEVKAV